MTKALRSACRGVVLATVLFVTVAAHDAHAQRVRGRLLELSSEDPIPAGIVTLLSADGAAVLNGVSDREGYWTLDAPGPGSYYVAAARIGYQRWVSGPVTLQAEDDWNSVFRLRRLPVMMEPVVISARATRQYLDRAGFYQRQHANFGHFMSPEDIEKRRATTVTELLTGLPGVSVGLTRTGGSVGVRAVELRGSDVARGGVCRPRVFLDGIMYAQGDSRPRREDDEMATEARLESLMQRVDQAISLDDIGHPSTIAAIEIYRSATQVPVQFGGASVETLCGVIVIWTRTGRTTTDQR
jgi:hypothetical protein